MKKNVGGLDQSSRILVGFALTAATATGYVPIWGYLGVVLLATGLLGYCPLYPVLGISTCKKT